MKNRNNPAYHHNSATTRKVGFLGNKFWIRSLQSCCQQIQSDGIPKTKFFNICSQLVGVAWAWHGRGMIVAWAGSGLKVLFKRSWQIVPTYARFCVNNFELGWLLPFPLVLNVCLIGNNFNGQLLPVSAKQSPKGMKKSSHFCWWLSKSRMSLQLLDTYKELCMARDRKKGLTVHLGKQTRLTSLVCSWIMTNYDRWIDNSSWGIRRICGSNCRGALEAAMTAVAVVTAYPAMMSSFPVLFKLVELIIFLFRETDVLASALQNLYCWLLSLLGLDIFD